MMSEILKQKINAKRYTYLGTLIVLTPNLAICMALMLADNLRIVDI